MKSFRNSSGMTLIELMMASAIGIIAIMGSYYSLNLITQSNSDSSIRLDAAELKNYLTLKIKDTRKICRPDLPASGGGQWHPCACSQQSPSTCDLLLGGRTVTYTGTKTRNISAATGLNYPTTSGGTVTVTSLNLDLASAIPTADPMSMVPSTDPAYPGAAKCPAASQPTVVADPFHGIPSPWVPPVDISNLLQLSKIEIKDSGAPWQSYPDLYRINIYNSVTYTPIGGTSAVTSQPGEAAVDTVINTYQHALGYLVLTFTKKVAALGGGTTFQEMIPINVLFDTTNNKIAKCLYEDESTNCTDVGGTWYTDAYGGQVDFTTGLPRTIDKRCQVVDECKYGGTYTKDPLGGGPTPNDVMNPLTGGQSCDAGYTPILTGKSISSVPSKCGKNGVFNCNTPGAGYFIYTCVSCPAM